MIFGSEKTSKMISVFQNPVFLFGLIFKVILIIFIAPAPVVNWYLPFLESSISQFHIDPWGSWGGKGENLEAFPYGYVMWALFVPLIYFSKLLGLNLLLGYSITLLVFDLIALILLIKLIDKNNKTVITFYWLSPIVLFGTYILGYNDLIPITLIIGSLYLTKETKLFWAAVLLIAAISAKLSMIIALPFFCIYLINKKSFRQLIPEFTAGILMSTIIFLLPFAFSVTGIEMLFNNPEMGKVLKLSLDYGTNELIYLIPLAYLMIVYSTWRLKRLNFELFFSLLGLSFLLVVILTAASPGWYIWVIPLIIYYQINGDISSRVIVLLFSSLYILNNIPESLSETHVVLLQSFSKLQFSNIVMFGFVNSMVGTAITGCAIILASSILRQTINRNDFFRLTRKPLVIGIAGDSGSGKDTFSDALTGLFGDHSVTAISGDGYHRWDRQKSIWNVLTHLNPMANNLDLLAKDVFALADGKNVITTEYDHQKGKISRLKKIKSKDFIIVSGLHALYHPMLTEKYNLSVYLDMDEELRRYFKMKRDVNIRGHSKDDVIESIEKRLSDTRKFIHPQKKKADLVFAIKPTRQDYLKNLSDNQEPNLCLSVHLNEGSIDLSLKKVLTGIFGLTVEITQTEDLSELSIDIDGEITRGDIASAAEIICPNINDFLDIQPKWEENVLGLMQLISLSHIYTSFTTRLTQ